MRPRPSPGKQRRRKKTAKITEAEQEALAREVRRLRSLLEEVAEIYIVRISGSIQQLVEHFDGTRFSEMDEIERVSINQYEQIMASIRSLEVRAKKGRRKDLKQIENLVARIEGIISS